MKSPCDLAPQPASGGPLSPALRLIAATVLGDYGGISGWAARLGELKFSRDAEA